MSYDGSLESFKYSAASHGYHDPFDGYNQAGMGDSLSIASTGVPMSSVLSDSKSSLNLTVPVSQYSSVADSNQSEKFRLAQPQGNPTGYQTPILPVPTSHTEGIRHGRGIPAHMEERLYQWENPGTVVENARWLVGEVAGRTAEAWRNYQNGQGFRPKPEGTRQNVVYQDGNPYQGGS
jgi:hypothetical protein